jgi:hypothetical protein
MDFGKYKDAASTNKAIAWAIGEYHKLELKLALAFICDNTNSNSGTGKVGGFVVQMSREHDIPMFRIPCTGICFLISSSFRHIIGCSYSPCSVHVLHIGWGAGRVHLMGKLPKISERFTVHPWNLYWLCYKELGKQDPRSLNSFPCNLIKNWSNTALCNSIQTGPKQPCLYRDCLI